MSFNLAREFVISVIPTSIFDELLTQMHATSIEMVDED